MRRLDLRQALLALDVVGDEVHRARPIERQDRVDVLDVVDVELPADADHAAGFQLEDRDRLAAVSRSKVAWSSSGIVSMSKSGVCSWISVDGVGDDRERFQPEEIHLQHARDRSSGPIAYWLTIEPSLARVSGMYSERSRSLMTTPAACTPTPRVSPSSFVAYSHSCCGRGLRLRPPFSARDSCRSRPAMCSIAPVSLFFLSTPVERDAELVRDHLRHAIRVAVAPAQHARHVAHHATSRPACQR